MRIVDNAVHIWRARLRVSAHELAAAAHTLSDDEQRRAAEFRFEHDRNRFVAARGALRCILSTYVQESPHDLHLAVTTHGKPVLDGNDRDLRFSASHREDWALYAVAHRRKVGVDTEPLQDFADLTAVAAQFFAPAEAAAIAALEVPARLRGFHTCWTRKEAFVKALGCGLSLPLNSFVIYGPEADPKLVWHGGQCWSVETFTPAEGYIAAVVAQGGRIQLMFRDWDWRFDNPGGRNCKS